MKTRYALIAKLFGESELTMLEDALLKHEKDNPSLTGDPIFENLKSDITDARRWRHQFGRTQHY